ncbi:hypothetical protein C1N63_12965 [Pantoea ananatis]|uniref:DUF2971 domain-containing protein n=1 Tax=Pantoea ananas TaxID=553 RepID=UPI000D727ECF|nr:DUF2971 domain-containing protein [Pantoea ananatis]AWQ19661.1 hypothetical protein C1N63_12965 [Pantoea ananatis]
MIYHYCAAPVFKSIISTKQVWLTDITKLNDTTEYKSGFELIQEVLKTKGLEEHPLLRGIDSSNINTSFRILVGCFSREGDLGSQWSSYADQTRGLSIGFDEHALDQYNLSNRFVENNYQPISQHIKILEVNYDKDAFTNKVSSFIEDLDSRNMRLKYELMAVGLRRLAALYKDPYFKDEREIRVMIELESHINDKYALDERVNAYGENATYHKLLTSFDDLSAISEVIIGPNCSYTQADVESLLELHGLSSVSVKHSSGRNRYRQPNS